MAISKDFVDNPVMSLNEPGLIFVLKFTPSHSFWRMAEERQLSDKQTFPGHHSFSGWKKIKDLAGELILR